MHDLRLLGRTRLVETWTDSHHSTNHSTCQRPVACPPHGSWWVFWLGLPWSDDNWGQATRMGYFTSWKVKKVIQESKQDSYMSNAVMTLQKALGRNNWKAHLWKMLKKEKNPVFFNNVCLTSSLANSLIQPHPVHPSTLDPILLLGVHLHTQSWSTLPMGIFSPRTNSVESGSHFLSIYFFYLI